MEIMKIKMQFMLQEEEEFDQKGYLELVKETYRTDRMIVERDGYYVLADRPAPTAEEQLEDLRSRREVECFRIINRGQLWYSTLTEQQKYELNYWYQAWLNVTVTKAIPAKPYWIK